MMLHPPEVARKIKLSQARIIIEAIWKERNRQAEQQAEMMSAMLQAIVGKATMG